MKPRWLFILSTLLCLAGCQSAKDVPQVSMVSSATPQSVQAGTPTVEMTLETVATPTTTLETIIATDAEIASSPQAPTALTTISATQDPNLWKEWPVIPAISARTLAIYQDGLVKGRDPHAFSKVGDCETMTEWFLVDFDKGPTHYDLGSHTDLKAVIDFYTGSYGRLGVAAQRGFTAASVLNPYWRDVQQCGKNETPLACEVRMHQPSLALIMLGTNDVARPETFEKNLRKVIEAAISEGVVPLLTTKADNLEGDERINATIARLAGEYDIPLWNFWRAVQALPDHGLQEDKAHLTWAPNTFSDPLSMQRAWPVRNLTALETLAAFQAAVSTLH